MENLVRMAVQNKRAIVFMALLRSLERICCCRLLWCVPEAEFPAAYRCWWIFGLMLSQMEAEIVKPVEEAVMLVPGVQAVAFKPIADRLKLMYFSAGMKICSKPTNCCRRRCECIQHVLPDGVALNIRRINTSTFPIASYSLYSTPVT
ncbi:MAG: hypothetical protein R3C26_19165 [Calditrichia bacterium]